MYSHSMAHAKDDTPQWFGSSTKHRKENSVDVLLPCFNICFVFSVLFVVFCLFCVLCFVFGGGGGGGGAVRTFNAAHFNLPRFDAFFPALCSLQFPKCPLLLSL